MRVIWRRIHSTVAKASKDFNQTAFDIVARSTGTPTTDELAKSANTREGGKARAEKLTPERRSEIARAAAGKRWAKPVTQT